MEKVKVVKLFDDEITFSDGSKLGSYHDQDCCESHYLSMDDISLEDFEGLEFDLSGDNFFKRIEDYGIAMSEFEKAWYRNCPIHRKERFIFFRKCWKCEVKRQSKTISEAKILIKFIKP